MAQRSTISRLNPDIRAECDAALKRGCTIDEMLVMLRGLGVDIARSSVGRYTKQYSKLAEHQREIAAISNAFATEFGDENDNLAKLSINILQSLITKHALPLMGNKESGLSTIELRQLAAAVKDAVSAAKMEDERRRAIRLDAFKEAAKVGTAAAKSAGASDEVLAQIRASILGIEI